MNNNLSRRAFLGVAGGAAAALALAGCSGDQSSSSETPTTTGGTEGGGTITASLSGAADGYNPQTAVSSVAVSANWLVVEGLYGLDPHTYEVFDELADGDPMRIDETTYEISLRSGAQFSDGTSVTPDDVASSFALASADDSPFGPLLAPISSVAKKDGSTVTVTTSISNFSLLKERLALVRVTPSIQPVAAMNKRPIGSGPWRYDSIGDDAIEMVPNEHYNGDHPANDSGIRFELQGDGSARSTAEREGTTLVMEAVPYDNIGDLEQAGCSLDTQQGLGARFLMFNVKKAPWDNVLVRQAVMYALDYDHMIENTFSGLASVPTSFVAEGLPCYHAASTAYTQNLEWAQELLAQAAIEPGDIELRTTDGDEISSMASEIADDLSALGFNVSIKTDTASATYAAIDGGEAYDLVLDEGDPSCFGGDADLLLGWWYASDLWMGTRCPWNDTSEYAQLRDLMNQALAQAGDERQSTWNQCLDLVASNVVLYPVLHVPSVTAAWRDAPNSGGTKIKNFYGIGAPGLSLLDTTTISA